ncbi:50S ribosomal protein L28 [Streptomyces sp. NBC_00996]|uniref:50S ribosomal protein L28 n=1 Tax=Streptomyces sp. NBC_00996 TaxID=2903710 RepID=UPI00386BBD0B|nr:50S ribosomal protein L28 [Streptomyces sp. NBC_00996]
MWSRSGLPGRVRLTGARPGFGNRISHSHRRTSRRFGPNVQRKRYWLPSEGRRVRLRLSTRGSGRSTIGVEAAVARIRAQGVEV